MAICGDSVAVWQLCVRVLVCVCGCYIKVAVTDD